MGGLCIEYHQMWVKVHLNINIYKAGRRGGKLEDGCSGKIIVIDTEPLYIYIKHLYKNNTGNEIHI